LQEIVALNPSLLRLQTPSDMEFDLHLPPGTQDVYLERIKSIPEGKRLSWRFHTVKPGESLEGIATALHSHASQIAEANGVSVSESLSPGDELVVPVASAAGAVHPQRYTARKGDTLVTIADRFSVSVDELRKWNHLSSSAVATGRTLAVSEPIALAPAMRSRASSGRHSRGRRGASATSTLVAGSRMAKGHSKGASSKSASGKSSTTGGSGARSTHKAAR
jgi:membrane-bound lytic murein transglycosylase D